MTAIYKQAIETYGKEEQLNIAIEELSELIKEICKHKRGEDNICAIVEEMADCYIMLEQMKMIFELDDGRIIHEMNRKTERLKKRLSGEW
jgi:DNA helicase IV